MKQYTKEQIEQRIADLEEDIEWLEAKVEQLSVHNVTDSEAELGSKKESIK